MTLDPVKRRSAHLKVDPFTGALRDEHGREVILRGFNVGGRSKWAPFLPFELPDANTASAEELREVAARFLDRLVSWGANVVRLPFSWEALEPTEGQWDEVWLSRYALLIDLCHARRLGVVIDFHQDIYASSFGGDGFPQWTLPPADRGPVVTDCRNWFLKYLADRPVQSAFDRFWANANGVQDAFARMWRTMAARFGAHPAVIGFETINEPGWGSADLETWRERVLTPFHGRMAQLFHEAAPEALVFFDGPGIDALSPQVPHARPEGMGLVYAPHLYDPGLITSNPWTGTDPMARLDDLAAFRDDHSTPVFLGEFGVGNGAKEAGVWLARVLDGLDTHRLSATLWEYSESASRWNHEDLSVIDPDGSEREVLDVFVRPWLRALSGQPGHFRWDAAARTGELVWSSGAVATEVVIPSRALGDGLVELDIHGRAARAVFDHELGEIRALAAPGAEVTLTFHLTTR